MTEHDGDVVIFQVQDADILEVIEDADALLARLVADGALLTGGIPRPTKRLHVPARRRRRR